MVFGGGDNLNSKIIYNDFFINQNQRVFLDKFKKTIFLDDFINEQTVGVDLRDLPKLIEFLNSLNQKYNKKRK